MATRLYPSLAQQTGIPTVARRGGWEVLLNASTANYVLGDKSGTANGPAAYKTTTGLLNGTSLATNPADYCGVKHISAPFLSSGAFSGNMTWCLSVVESNAALNAYMYFHGWIMAPDGSLRGTFLSNTAGSTEYPVGGAAALVARSQTHALTSVDVLVNDRIVLESGIRLAAGSIATNIYAQFMVGGTGSDDAVAGVADYLNRPGWVEFSGIDELFNPPSFADFFSFF